MNKDDVEKIFCKNCHIDTVKLVRYKRNNSHFIVFCSECDSPLWEHLHGDTPDEVVIEVPKRKPRIRKRVLN